MDAISSSNNPYRPILQERPPVQWCDRAINVALIAGGILILAGLVAACVAAGVFLWPVCTVVVVVSAYIGLMVIMALQEPIDALSKSRERDYLINFRKWHKEQVCNPQPLTIAASCPAPFSSENLRMTKQEVSSQGSDEAGFDDYKKAVKDTLPREFSSVAEAISEEMLFVPFSRELMSAPKEKAISHVIEAGMNRDSFDFELKYPLKDMNRPEISRENEGDTVKLTVKSKYQLVQKISGNRYWVGDVWLVSVFTYRMTADRSSFEKSYQYGTEYIRASWWQFRASWWQ